jgi:chaperone modulatory protein CbpM
MQRHEPTSATVLDEQVEFSLGDLCEICDLHAEAVIEMVTEGVVAPRGRRPERWRFSGVAVVRVQTALRLQRDLGVNLPGAALALELIEEIEALRAAQRRRPGAR